MISLLLAGLALQPEMVAKRGHSIQIPPPMATYVGAYMSCITTRMKADRRMPAAREAARLVYEDARRSCANVRKSAARDSETSLAAGSSYGDRKRRQELVERTLAASEGAFEALLTMPPPDLGKLTNTEGQPKNDAQN